MLDRDHVVIAGRARREAARPRSRHRGPRPRARSARVRGSGSTGGAKWRTPWRRMRSGWSSVSLPCAQPMRFPSASITVSGSMPCRREARVEVDADVRAEIGGKRLEARGAEDRHARMHLQADHHLRRLLGQPFADRAPERTDLVLQLPAEQPRHRDVAQHGNTPSEPPPGPAGQPLIVTTRGTPRATARSTAARRRA